MGTCAVAGAASMANDAAPTTTVNSRRSDCDIEARQKLRAAVKDAKTYAALAKSHKLRSAWEWAKNSPALKEARKVLSTE